MDDGADNTTLNLNLPFITRLKLFLLDHLPHPLLRLLEIKSPATPSPPVSNVDITVDASRQLWFRLFRPSTTASPLPLIVYFHGGGFVRYSPHSHFYHHLCTRIAAHLPALVASVNYRLAPQHRYPVQYDDSFDAFQFIVDYLSPLNRCFLAGDSAGANIAHHVAIRPSDRIKLDGLVLLQPFFGGQERTQSEVRLMRAPVLNVHKTDWFWTCFLPQGADRNHPAAHVFGGGGGVDIARVEFPGVLVVVGGLDPLQDWQKRYVEWLKKCGKQAESIEYPNAFHGFYAFPELPEFELCIENVSDFIRKKSAL